MLGKQNKTRGSRFLRNRMKLIIQYFLVTNITRMSVTIQMLTKRVKSL